MRLFANDREKHLAIETAALAYANPFLEDRILHEQRLLGRDYVPSQPYWSLETDLDRKDNVERISELSTRLAITLRDRLAEGAKATDEERRLYEDVVIYVVYERYRDGFLELDVRGERGRVGFWPAFRRDLVDFLPERAQDAAHLFACFYQVRRAFQHIFTAIIGRSRVAARLRAAAWQSIFSHDMRRYRRSLHARMADTTTLITGPTGTGKELVARAIGLSRYLPFDERTERFAEGSSFVGLNLTALSPTVLESELFGHRKGSFTGAMHDREGYLESCGEHGTVFLDEIGEVDPAVQVKLLRVLQNRTFQRLGDTATRRFKGKIVAATNRDLVAEIARGRFREDFYYRLCSDTIVTPSLDEQLRGEPDELRHLVRFISARVAGEEEAATLTDQVCDAIAPMRDYRWPGNFRELEQCVR
ncbi:MAG: sigma-54-dependent Fis family transcriptional regulator, partial [Acidobacteria bacterium]|nr:sigma-54-dependent Fis family transcriptional regulator [Acidobacteriota bacterium]